MAKSQYTDSITGEVLVDLRSINNKIINFGSVIPIQTSKNMYTSSVTKYSDKGIASNSSLNYYGSININTFTLSWWQNILSNDDGWDGAHMENESVRFHFLARNNNNWTSTVFAQYTPSWNTLDSYDITSPPSNNTWYHYAFIYDGTNYKFYRNGNLIITRTYSKIGKLYRVGLVTAGNHKIGHSIFDDMVLIKDQVLWTGNFAVPNYLLTGDKELPKKIKTRQLLYPPRYGDYFDKAFIY